MYWRAQAFDELASRLAVFLAPHDLLQQPLLCRRSRATLLRQWRGRPSVRPLLDLRRWLRDERSARSRRGEATAPRIQLEAMVAIDSAGLFTPSALTLEAKFLADKQQLVPVAQRLAAIERSGHCLELEISVIGLDQQGRGELESAVRELGSLALAALKLKGPVRLADSHAVHTGGDWRTLPLALRSTSWWAGLQALDLSFSTEIVSLEACRGLRSLRTIDLMGCRKLEAGLEPALRACVDLEAVILSHCYMLPDGELQALARGGPRRLSTLRLAKCLSLRDVAVLATAPALRQLVLDDCRALLPEGVGAVRAAVEGRGGSVSWAVSDWVDRRT